MVTAEERVRNFLQNLPSRALSLGYYDIDGHWNEIWSRGRGERRNWRIVDLVGDLHVVLSRSNNVYEEVNLIDLE